MQFLWTQEALAMLVEMYATTPTKVLCSRLGCCPRVLASKAHELGLHGARCKVCGEPMRQKSPDGAHSNCLRKLPVRVEKCRLCNRPLRKGKVPPTLAHAGCLRKAEAAVTPPVSRRRRARNGERGPEPHDSKFYRERHYALEHDIFLSEHERRIRHYQSRAELELPLFD